MNTLDTLDTDSSENAGQTTASAPLTRIYVLFTDVVGFSSFDIDKQRKIAEHLNKIVHDIMARRHPQEAADRKKRDEAFLFIPTGDGMMIVFRRDQDRHAPIKWAKEIIQEVLRWNAETESSQQQFALRMGMHSENVSPYRDINGLDNVAGPGTNMAQRVMDCGDAWHILASSAYGDSERSHKELSNYFSSKTKTFTVKGGKTIAVYNVHGLYDDVTDEKWKQALTEQEKQNNLKKPTTKVWPNAEEKPPIGIYPKKLRPGLFKVHELLTKDARSIIPGLTWCCSHNNLERLKALSHARQICQKDRLWDHVWRILLPFINEPTNMELTSLINPSDWEKQEWLDHQENIFHAATTGRPGIARRLHVVQKTFLEDPSSLSQLLSLMIAEYVCSVRTRILVVGDLEDVKDADDKVVGYSWKDFFLFDSGTFYAPGGQYALIITDIDFKQPNADWCLYVFSFNPDMRFIYDELRANFYRGWHARHSGAKGVGEVYRVMDVYTMAKDKAVEAEKDKLIKREQIEKFLPYTIRESFRHRDDWVKEVRGLLEHYVEHDAAMAEDKLQKEMAELRRHLCEKSWSAKRLGREADG